jgi:hypothetical protein
VISRFESIEALFLSQLAHVSLFLGQVQSFYSGPPISSIRQKKKKKKKKKKEEKNVSNADIDAPGASVREEWESFH